MRVSRTERRRRRHSRHRRRLIGTAERPRLAIRRSLHHIYVEVIDDTRLGGGHTLVSASTREKDLADLTARTNTDAARRVGERIAKKAKDVGIGMVIFDTSGLKYHGRVKALADAARAGGLEF